MYVYITAVTFIEDGEDRYLYTVGHWMPNGTFKDESEYDNKEAAAGRVNYLNGGMPDYELNKICSAAEFYVSQNT